MTKITSKKTKGPVVFKTKDPVVFGRNSFSQVNGETVAESRLRKIADDKRWERAFTKAEKISSKLKEQNKSRATKKNKTEGRAN